MSKAPDNVQPEAVAANDSLIASVHAPAMSRRELLALGTGLALSHALPAAAAEEGGLNDRAARRGMKFGCAVLAKRLRIPAYARAVAQESSILVPENEMKWGHTEQRRGRPDYGHADAIAAFAAGHGIGLRGHTAMWYKSRPAWTDEALAAPGGRELALKHVTEIVGHFRGRVAEWDVVNEMIEPKDGLPGGLRKFPPYAPGDVGFIADCFHAARESDPAAKLYYNDYGLEYASEGEDLRRAAALHILEGLKARKAPIDGFGIQCHLKVGNNFKPGIFRDFLAAIAATGVEISLTELDIDDERLPSDVAERDRLVAEHAREFLAAAFEERAVTKLLTWGLVEMDRWLDAARPRADRQSHRPLPLDDGFKRKPLWHAIAGSFDNAPLRA